jgi:DNA-3-methyladenine glycosylase
MHWMLNIVTGEENQPEAVLIRACVDAGGPGKLTKRLGITGSENRSSVVTSEDLWIGDDGFRCDVTADKRVGIGYASPEDQDRLWRFKIKK